MSKIGMRELLNTDKGTIYICRLPGVRIRQRADNRLRQKLFNYLNALKTPPSMNPCIHSSNNNLSSLLLSYIKIQSWLQTFHENPSKFGLFFAWMITSSATATIISTLIFRC